MRGKRMFFLVAVAIALLAIHTASACAGVAVICNPSLAVAAQLDKNILARIFTGRTVQIDGIAVIPVNLPVGREERRVFLHHVLKQNDDEYVAYWLVRKSIGKGIPPQEVNTSQDVLRFIRSQAGAVGYINDRDLPPDVRVLFTIP